MTNKEYAKFLSRFALDNEGRFDIEKLNAIMEYIAKNSESSKHLLILKELKKIVSSSEYKHLAKIEYATKLDKVELAKLEEFVTNKLSKKMDFEYTENSNLIAGIKIMADDMLWENSLSRTLGDF